MANHFGCTCTVCRRRIRLLSGLTPHDGQGFYLNVFSYLPTQYTPNPLTAVNKITHSSHIFYQSWHACNCVLIEAASSCAASMGPPLISGGNAALATPGAARARRQRPERCSTPITFDLVVTTHLPITSNQQSGFSSRATPGSRTAPRLSRNGQERGHHRPQLPHRVVNTGYEFSSLVSTRASSRV